MPVVGLDCGLAPRRKPEAACAPLVCRKHSSHTCHLPWRFRDRVLEILNKVVHVRECCRVPDLHVWCSELTRNQRSLLHEQQLVRIWHHDFCKYLLCIILRPRRCPPGARLARCISRCVCNVGVPQVTEVQQVREVNGFSHLSTPVLELLPTLCSQ